MKKMKKSTRAGIAAAALLIGLAGSGKSIYSGIQNIGQSKDFKTGGVERILDIE